MFILVRSFLWLLIYTVFFFLFQHQTYRPLREYPSDLPGHISFISHINDIAHPLWHYIVKFISSIFHISLQLSAISFTALLVVILFIIINNILEFSLENQLNSLSSTTKRYLILFITFSLLISSAIYMPFFNKNLYLGQSACGIWHNVTLLMVKPFAFLSIFFTIRFIQAANIKFFIVALLSTIISIFAKPSFIIIYLPALYVFVFYFIYQSKRTILQNLLQIKNVLYKHIFYYLILVTFFSILILIIQFLIIYGGGNPVESKIIFDFLGVWSLYTPNIIISLVLIIAFPILVLILMPHKKSDFYIFSLIMFIISLIIYSLFAESGLRYSDGNFAWSMHIAYHILFLFSTIEFIKGYDLLVSWEKHLLSIVLSLHILSGLYYFVQILNGQHYI